MKPPLTMRIRSLVVTCAMLHCGLLFSKAEEMVDPNVLIPALGKEDHAFAVKLVGDNYQVRLITSSMSLLPLKLHKVQVRGPGVVLFDADGMNFPVMRKPPPDLRKFASMRTFREILNLLTGPEKKQDESQRFVLDENVVEAALQTLQVGMGGNISLRVAYASDNRVVLVSCTCMYMAVKEGGGLDTPFSESMVSTWMSPKFPVNPPK